MTSEEIYRTLRREILLLTLSPGQQIAETELAERFSVSRTPVRSAIQRLRKEKLLEVYPQRGTFVAAIDFDYVKQLIYMRTAVELRLIPTLCDGSRPEMLREMAENLAKQKLLLSAGTKPAQFYRLDSRFHQIYFTHCGMEAVWRILHQFHVHYTRFRMLDISGSGLFPQFYEEHCRIYDHIKNGRNAELAPLLTHHLESGLVRIQEQG